METLKKYCKRYFIDAMGAMALGLFASLLIGTILKTLGQYTGLDFLVQINTYAAGASGMAIGVAVAYALKADPLVMYSCAAVGAIGYSLPTFFESIGKDLTAGPAGTFVAVIVACEVAKFVSKKTKVDILVTPTVTILVGYAVSRLVCPAVSFVMYWLGRFINEATMMHPFVMGIIVSVVVGMVLTLPISSAAICAMIGISGLAGGAATVGCCAQMVGFAVISFRENRWGGLVSQGLGTSMLQMGNICRKPLIWLPPTLAAAVCGPLSTLVFRLECEGVSAGMGTCGLVGPIGIIAATEHTPMMWIGLLTLCIAAPALLSLAFNEILRGLGLIKTGDMALTLN